jgi:hypothetical protein
MSKSYKRYIPPDKGWNIRESKRNNWWGKHHSTYNGKNMKVYWLNIFNRKLRQFFNKMIKEGEQ